MFKIIENFVTIDELYEIKDVMDESKWVHNNESYQVEGDSNAVFWSMDIKDEHFNQKILKRLEQYVNKKFEIIRVTANGQTYGLDGNWHQDVSSGVDKYTFLIYVSDIHRHNIKEIGGYTKFNINQMVIDVEPFQGRSVFFDSRIFHKGMAPLTKNMLRISIAFKLKEIK